MSEIRSDSNLFFHDMATGLHLCDFFQWVSPDLLESPMRDMYARFLVAASLGLDLRLCSARSDSALCLSYYADGDATARIQVISSANLDAWSPESYPQIQFRFPVYAGFVESDVYIFALYTTFDSASAEPTALDGWAFYALPRGKLPRARASISIGDLEALEPIYADYDGILDAVLRCVSERYNAEKT